MTNQLTYQDFMALNKEIQENNIYNSLTNGRKVGDYVKHKENVLSGYNKILDFVYRGMKVQVKLIK